jgi:cell cycle sensor histidine kinase DivJ
VRVVFRGRAAGTDEGGARPPVFNRVELRARKSWAVEGAVTAALRELAPEVPAREAQPADAGADESKSRFLANVSHELRTPLNAIIGFSEMLAHPDLAPHDAARRREYANIIHASGEHLLGLVNTILDVSKIESGHFELAHEPFGLAWLVDFGCDLVKLKAEAKKIELRRDCPAGLGDIVADKRACRQILLNLLSNAVKFTPEGGTITASARIDGGFVELTVADSGVGVAPEDFVKLGDPFFQARSAYDRPYEGAGLGLSIVRGLVGLHGGGLSFASAPGQGARVTVRLPLDCRRVEKTSARIECLPPRPRAASEFRRPFAEGKKIA